MPTPAKGYRLKDGTRVPGTTTITGQYGDKQGIIYKANRLALDPLLQARHLLDLAVKNVTDGWAQDAREFLSLNPDNWDHKLFWGKAADAGTCAHDMVDSWIHGRPFDPEPYTQSIIDIAVPAFEAFRRWADQSRLVVGETEIQLVSEKYRFGGTRDAVTVSGKRSVVDWKTSNAVWPEMLVQLAAYAILDEENRGEPIDGGFHLLRFSKQSTPDDPVHFSHHHWSHLDEARRAFLLMRELYDLMARISKYTA